MGSGNKEKEEKILEELRNERLTAAKSDYRDTLRNRVAIAAGVLPLLFVFIIPLVNFPSWALGVLVLGIFLSIFSFLATIHTDAKHLALLINEMTVVKIYQTDPYGPPSLQMRRNNLYLYVGASLATGCLTFLVLSIFIFGLN